MLMYLSRLSTLLLLIMFTGIYTTRYEYLVPGTAVEVRLHFVRYLVLPSCIAIELVSRSRINRGQTTWDYVLVLIVRNTICIFQRTHSTQQCHSSTACCCCCCAALQVVFQTAHPFPLLTALALAEHHIQQVRIILVAVCCIILPSGMMCAVLLSLIHI